MAQVKNITLVAVALLTIGGIGSFSYVKFCGNSTVVVINRLIPTSDRAYYMSITDRTTFSVNQILWLYKFDIPRIYIYESETEGYFTSITAEVTIVEMSNLTSVDEQIIYARSISVSSKNVTQVILPAEINIEPNKFYEIRLKFPTMLHPFMYKGTHAIREYEVTKSFFGSIGTVKFYQNNPYTDTPNYFDVKSRLSQGVIQRLYFKY